MVFDLKDAGVVDGALRGTVESDARVHDSHVGFTHDATDCHSNGDNDSFRGIAYASVLFRLKEDGVVDGARRGTVVGYADVCHGHVGSTDDATALHPYGDNATFSGNAHVIVLFTLKDDGVGNGACRGTVESDADVCGRRVISTDDATDLQPSGDHESFVA